MGFVRISSLSRFIHREFNHLFTPFPQVFRKLRVRCQCRWETLFTIWEVFPTHSFKIRMQCGIASGRSSLSHFKHLIDNMKKPKPKLFSDGRGESYAKQWSIIEEKRREEIKPGVRSSICRRTLLAIYLCTKHWP